MRRPATLLTLAFAMCGLSAAYAADVTAICKLADDKRTVTVAFTNPESKTKQCEVNCDMAIPNGIGTVVCVKPVPGGAQDLVLCTSKDDGPGYTSVKGTNLNCRDLDGTPLTPEQQKAEEDESDALAKQMQEQGLEMLKRMQKQNQ